MFCADYTRNDFLLACSVSSYSGQLCQSARKPIEKNLDKVGQMITIRYMNRMGLLGNRATANIFTRGIEESKQ